jgi:hypothetical protein
MVAIKYELEQSKQKSPFIEITIVWELPYLKVPLLLGKNICLVALLGILSGT